MIIVIVSIGIPSQPRGIRKVAICAGSGSTVFKSLPMDVDALFTGELSHHEVLEAVENGRAVFLCGHTNTERGFLQILKKQLQESIDEDVSPSTIEVIISQRDQDPLTIY